MAHCFCCQHVNIYLLFVSFYVPQDVLGMVNCDMFCVLFLKKCWAYFLLQALPSGSDVHVTPTLHSNFASPRGIALGKRQYFPIIGSGDVQVPGGEPINIIGAGWEDGTYDLQFLILGVINPPVSITVVGGYFNVIQPIPPPTGYECSI